MCAKAIVVFITLLVTHLSESKPPQDLQFRLIDFSEMDDPNLFNPANQYLPSTLNQAQGSSRYDENKKSIGNHHPCNPSGNKNKKTNNWPLDKLIKLLEVYQEVYILSGHINFPDTVRGFQKISQELYEKHRIDESLAECMKAYTHSLAIMRYDSARRSPQDVAKIEKMREIHRNTQQIREERQNRKKDCSKKRKSTNNIPLTDISAKKMNDDENWTLSEILALHTVYLQVLLSRPECVKFPNQEEAFLEISSTLKKQYGIKKTHAECLKMHDRKLRISRVYYSGNDKDDEEKIKQIREVIRRTGQMRDKRLARQKV